MTEPSIDTQGAAGETDTVEQPKPKDWQADAEKWKALARKHETTAKTNAEKAAQFDQQQQASMTELQRAQDAAAQAQAQLAETQLRLHRTSAARAAGLDVDMEQFLTGSTPEELAEQAKVLASRLAATTQPRVPAPNFAQGTSGAQSGALNTNDHMNALIRAQRT